VKKGAPIILEIGGRDAANGQVSALRRDDLWRADAKVNFAAQAATNLSRLPRPAGGIQHSLHTQATRRRDAAITRGITTLAALAEYFSEDKRYPGWVELNWSRPTGAALDRWWNS
jgi:prolyl-tRNA synthetase